MHIYIVDAFTVKSFAGNPAGVCILEECIPDELMRLIAQEVKHSETAFALKHGKEYHLRWFTPQTEVPLCGHATLATAHILWEQQYESREHSLVFHTRESGTLIVNSSAGMIVMDFPQQFATPVEPPELLSQALGVYPVWVGCDDLRYLVEFCDEQAVTAVMPQYELMKRLEKRVIITAPSAHSRYDFVSRVFAPSVGVNEDPVTGSAHCYLAPYWSKKLGKRRVVGYQASFRPGIVSCEVCNHERVLIQGTAKTVIKGELLL